MNTKEIWEEHRKIVNHWITTHKFNENAKNEKIELCGVARASVKISENGSRSKKISYPLFGRTMLRVVLSEKAEVSMRQH